MTRTIIIAAALALAATLPAIPAQAAGVARTFVSAAGNDSNNCANVLTPCRHLAAAYAATAANGEIYVLDPANYGSLTITGPVSIEGHGWASIAPPPSTGNAITINANPGDAISIIGVVLDGTGLAATDGIVFNSGGSLTVQDSVIRNFTTGVVFQPNAPSKLSISNTLVSDNSDTGITVEMSGPGTAEGVLDHVRLENDGIGVFVATNTGQTVNLMVVDSVSANNNYGVDVAAAGTGGSTVMIRNSTITNNATAGLYTTQTGVFVRVTRSTIVRNTIGWTAIGGAVVTSYADNNIDDNGSGNGAPPVNVYR
jgi:Right handed beta helix region